MTVPDCRYCGAELNAIFADLGTQPLANDFLTEARLREPETRLPLRVRVCGQCFLVQTDETPAPSGIFTEYAYFSSNSASWLASADAFAGETVKRFSLTSASLVLEVASNDGYQLQYFLSRGIPVLGVEPAGNVASHAIAKGIPTEVDFFGGKTAQRLKSDGLLADLMIAKNVLAHVPEPLDFLNGFQTLLKSTGVAVFEFPHLMNLIEHTQFDTIYHEHYSYLSFHTVERMLAAAGLRVFDVTELASHGGSLRVFVCHRAASFRETQAVGSLREEEAKAGVHDMRTYAGFQAKAERVKAAFLAFLRGAHSEGRKVCAYGAAAKGNTFLNFCGVTANDIVCVADRSTEKQNRFLPGSHIPVVGPERLMGESPDYVVILPWNLATEIQGQLADLERQGTRFVTAVPDLRIMP